MCHKGNQKGMSGAAAPAFPPPCGCRGCGWGAAAGDDGAVACGRLPRSSKVSAYTSVTVCLMVLRSSQVRVRSLACPRYRAWCRGECSARQSRRSCPTSRCGATRCARALAARRQRYRPARWWPVRTWPRSGPGLDSARRGPCPRCPAE